MFERYTEKARRVIFFATVRGQPIRLANIETEYLLLGLLREDKALTNRFLHTHASVESIRKQIEAHAVIREKVATSVDLPLSNEGKRVLAYAAEEAERLRHKHIGTEHLLLGLLREKTMLCGADSRGARRKARASSRRTRSKRASNRAGRRWADHHGQRQARRPRLLARGQWCDDQAPGILCNRSRSRGRARTRSSSRSCSCWARRASARIAASAPSP